MIDTLLLRAVRGGSENALKRIIDKYTAYVCVIIRNTVSGAITHEDIEEVASDVFFALWESAGRVETGNLKAYLGGIARNKAKNKLRGLTNELPLEEDYFTAAQDSLEDAVILQAERKTVERAILSMDAPDREIFLRHYYGTQTASAIADEIGTTEAAVKHRLIRGRKKLRKIISEELFEQ